MDEDHGTFWGNLNSKRLFCFKIAFSKMVLYEQKQNQTSDDHKNTDFLVLQCLLAG